METEKKLVDWSKHQFSKFDRAISHDLEISVYELKIPYTKSQSVKFTNIDGICTVSGDYGNYVFCREFHPKEGDYQSGFYFREKLESNSCQNALEYDEEQNLSDLQDELKRYCSEHGIDPDDSDDDYVEYLNSCINHCYDEVEYLYTAYRTCTDSVDVEDVIYRRKYKVQFSIILEAYEEMCNRIKIINDERKADFPA